MKIIKKDFLIEEYIKSNDLRNKILKNIEKYKMFKKYVYKWNKKINLTSYEEKDFDFHAIIEPLIIFNEINPPRNILDIGTGFGNPSISIAITFPEIEVYCSEINHKRLSFLHFIKKELKLNNLIVLKEEIPDFTFEIVTARAFMEKDDFLKFLKDKEVKYNFLWLFLKENSDIHDFFKLINYNFKNKNYFQVLI